MEVWKKSNSCSRIGSNWQSVKTLWDEVLPSTLWLLFCQNKKHHVDTGSEYSPAALSQCLITVFLVLVLLNIVWFLSNTSFPLPQVMQNNHIASVTLYGAPRSASQARPESSSSSHWTSNQIHIPFWTVLNLAPLLTEPLTQSQILNQADLTQNKQSHSYPAQKHNADSTFLNISWGPPIRQKSSRHSQPKPDYPRT